MDGTTEVKPSGSATSTPQQIVGGTRRRVYQQDEHLAMINRDTFDALESTIADKGLFSHLTVGCITFALTFGAEKVIEYHQTPTDAGYYQLWLCGIVGAVGVLFAILTIRKSRRYHTQRAGLFSEDKLLSDSIIMYTSDGTIHSSTPTS